MPILSIEFSCNIAYCFLYEGGKSYGVYEIPLGLTIHRTSAPDKVLDFVFSKIESEMKKKLSPDTQTIVTGDRIDSFNEAKNIKVFSVLEALRKLNKPLLDICHEGVFFLNRGYPAKLKSKEVSKWLTFKEAGLGVSNYLRNTAIYPQIIPQYNRDLSVKTAILKEMVHTSLEGLHDEIEGLQEPLAISGRFISGTFDPYSLMLGLADSMSFAGKLDILHDQTNYLHNLLALICYQEELQADLFPLLKFVSLGTIFSIPDGLEVLIDPDSERPLKVNIEKESLTVIPLSADTSIEVTLNSKKYGQKDYTVAGGEVGAVIDTREKPLNLDLPEVERINLLKRWAKVRSVEFIS